MAGQKQYWVWPVVVAGGVMWALYKIYNTPKLTYQWIDNNTVEFNLSLGSESINGTFSLTDAPQEITVKNYTFSTANEGEGFIGFGIWHGNTQVFYQSITKDTRSS